MKKQTLTIRYFALILLGITLFGFARILPVPAAYSQAAPGGVLPAAASVSPTSTQAGVEPTNTATPLAPIPTEALNASLFAFLQAPTMPVAQPYVVITAFQAGSYNTDVTIHGTINSTEFYCAGSPCTIPLQLGESRFTFWAQTAAGLIGETIYATVFAELGTDGYHVTVQSVSQFSQSFQDACLADWGIQDTSGPAWAEFPQYPYQLNTRIPLHHLAARLITYGVVDTKSCPSGGLSADMDWPNACGLQAAEPQMIVWQNQYDDAIWTAANTVGIPPKIIKTLIEVESQFWPGNERFYVDEYGLGQINQLGIDVLLRNDYNLYQQACQAVGGNCILPYVSLSAAEQAKVRGAVMATMNSTCTTCNFGFDLTRARQSIQFISQLLRANCGEAKTILQSRSATTDYESYWKFTMLAYHSGLACLSDAVKNTKAVGDPIDWEHVGPQVNCPGGRKYVDNFWAQLSLFDSYTTGVLGATPIVQFAPIIGATHTPEPSPTPMISTAHVVVTVYMDMNGDGTPQPNEGLDNIPVQLVFPDGKIMSATTQKGVASFDLSGTVTGTRVTATLPNLYRDYRFYVPQSGTVPIIFSFAQPTLPAVLP